MSDPWQAVILAGGKGTRLRPYTTVIPKPLMPVGDYPILEIILRQLKRAGVAEVILAVGYLSQLFHACFEDGRRFGLDITYSLEDTPLGTAGPLALLIDRLRDDFLVMNGDLLTTLNYGSLFDAHRRVGAAATIAVCRREVPIDFGVVETGEGSTLERYIEKPVYRFDVSMGINVLKSEAIRPYLRAGEPLDLPTLMMKLRDSGRIVHCFRDPCYWLDIGRVDDYQTANEIFESRRAEFLPDPE